YVYAVSPTSLARLKRMCRFMEEASLDWDIPSVKDNKARVADSRVLIENRLILESFQLEVDDGPDNDTQAVAEWLARNALPKNEENKFFVDKLSRDLVILPDQAFSYFVEHSTSVEPHVSIDDETGVAREGGLFYTENLPPESLLVAPLFCSDERHKAGNKPDEHMKAGEIFEKLKNGLNDQLLQVGGDATTGRGQVLLHFMEWDA
ncbi:MAG: type III-B CRISPR module RAMP protein Cmr4, partial [Gammaproteobacteria bacterium]|nr:type III-B CRISPR module RAMP protein Cmr4 [Gammaproteobacteria bacterium]